MSNDRPNLLFICADQYRDDFLGCAGADFVRTPNLDSIAERGVHFTQCSTNSPICAPARISLATGNIPSRYGADTNEAFLPASAPTYYQRLRNHGYAVGCVGKLDLGKPDKYNGVRGDRPRAFSWGFTHPVECEGKGHAGGRDTPFGPYTKWLEEQGLLQTFYNFNQERKQLRDSRDWLDLMTRDSPLPTEAFEDCFIGRRSVEWLDMIGDEFPWHLFVSFVGPHDPFDPPVEYAERYRDAEMPPPIHDDFEGKPGWIKRRAKSYPDERVAVARRQYCAAIEAIDDSVGRILEQLERSGQLDNTYIVFSADHGEQLGDHGQWAKHTPYESSMRVPLLVSGPGISGGRTSDALVELMDVNPTLCEFAGIEPQENIDARSFRGVVTGQADAHRDCAFAIEKNYRAVRTKTHKLIDNLNDRSELYDLESDPQELHNIYDEEPELVKKLQPMLNARQYEGQALR